MRLQEILLTEIVPTDSDSMTQLLVTALVGIHLKLKINILKTFGSIVNAYTNRPLAKPGTTKLDGLHLNHQTKA